jgi:hypothetical protein
MTWFWQIFNKTWIKQKWISPVAAAIIAINTVFSSVNTLLFGMGVCQKFAIYLRKQLTNQSKYPTLMCEYAHNCYIKETTDIGN